MKAPMSDLVRRIIRDKHEAQKFVTAILEQREKGNGEVTYIFEGETHVFKPLESNQIINK